MVKQSLSETEAEDFLEAAVKEVDRAKIAEKPKPVDLADELQKAIDKSWAEAPPRLRRQVMIGGRLRQRSNLKRRPKNPASSTAGNRHNCLSEETDR